MKHVHTSLICTLCTCVFCFCTFCSSHNQWRKKFNIRAACAARFGVQCFDVVWQTTTWNFHIWGSEDNASLHFLSLHENHSCQSSESTLHLFFTTCPTWNKRKSLNFTQSSILMLRFRCSCRRSFLNSLLTLRCWHFERRSLFRATKGDASNVSFANLSRR